MLVREAIDHLDGHAIIGVDRARKVCEVLGVSFDETLVMTWRDRKEALEAYGFVATKDGPGNGVDGLDLSYHVAKQLGLGRPGEALGGKGSQARVNQQAIRQELSKLGRL